MSSLDRSLDGMAFLSGHVGAVLRRRLREVGGIVLIAFALMTALALATWSVDDPSLSHATDAHVHNLLGRPGAIAADLVMQLLWLGSLALILPLSVWGYRLLGHRPVTRRRIRILFWVFGAVFTAAFASCLPRGGRWALPCRPGGVVGDAILRLPAMLLHSPHAGNNFLLATIFGFAALFAFAGAAGLIWRGAPDADDEVEEADEYDYEEEYEEPEEPDEDEDDEEAAGDDEKAGISLGRLMHAVLSLRARIARTFRGAPAQSAVYAEAPPPRRIEPRFERGARGGEEDDESDEEAAELQIEQAARKPKAAPRPVRRSASGYQLPSLNLLAAQRTSERNTLSEEVIQENATALEGVLSDFGVRGEIINARPGPVVTLYELEPAPGIKSSRVISLADDIARSMSALSARVAVVSGRNAIGIELPNPTREKVFLRELLAADELDASSPSQQLCLGKATGGEPVIVDLARMPHLLIAGTTGSGKSVAINTMILSLLYRLRPDQCRLIMVDPKMLELSVYDGIPHLLTPVVTDPKKAVVALKWAVREMEERYKKMSKLGVRNIDGYNARLTEAKSKGEELTRTVHTGFDKETGKAVYENEKLDLDPLPYIVIIVDEMADLMMVAGKDIEGAVQ